MVSLTHRIALMARIIEEMIMFSSISVIRVIRGSNSFPIERYWGKPSGLTQTILRCGQ